MNTKPINEMTIQELESIELQLWRAREQATVTLNQCANDLQLITNELAKRQQEAEQVEVPQLKFEK